MIAYTKELVEAAKKYGIEKLIFFSDHGMLDKEENFFPNVYVKEHGYEEEIARRQIYFLSDGSGCMQFYSGLSEEKNTAIVQCLRESGRIEKVLWLEGEAAGEEDKKLQRPRAILEMCAGGCSEDILDREEEKYHEMKGLHGYDPEHIREMNGFFLAYDPGNRLSLKGGKLKITDIPPMIKTLVMEGRTER